MECGGTRSEDGRFALPAHRKLAPKCANNSFFIWTVASGKKNPMTEPLPVPAASNTFERIKQLNVEDHEFGPPASLPGCWNTQISAILSPSSPKLEKPAPTAITRSASLLTARCHSWPCAPPAGARRGNRAAGAGAACPCRAAAGADGTPSCARPGVPQGTFHASARRS